jgi:two-component system OmpR family sensor kinase
VAQDLHRRLLYSQVAIGVVLLLSTATAISHARSGNPPEATWVIALAALLATMLAVTNIVALLRDRGSRRRHETVNEDEQTNRSKSDLVVASHDLCARLQGLATKADQLRRSSNASAEQQRSLESIASGAEQIEARLRRIVDVSGIQLGTVSLSRDLFSVAPVLERSVRLHGKAATTRGVSIHVEPCPLLSVIADRERIGLVVGSLLEYSIETSSPGTELLVSAVPVDNGVRFSLLDPGGIESARDQSTLVDDISLQLCRQIVEAHGGRMGVDANTSGRARWFTIPVEPMSR